MRLHRAPGVRPLLTRAALPVVVVAGLSLGLTGCGGHPTAHRDIAVESVSGHIAFDPTTITVDTNDNVVLAVSNTTSTVHGFSIEAYGLQEEIPPGGAEVKFKAVHPGTFKIYSQLKETDQIATLVVR